ncbi:uncharacterized protein LOC107849620 [Capsicum annuum]|uniref:uncharacterized protein LOC107849620 n=1 Tax=Capsicum annuum TaxID=4072 RepID=UPI001FB14896|nr:uncharacterized protein LOC107849620 [Capsicum annuum]
MKVAKNMRNQNTRGHLCLYPVHAGPSHGSLISPKFGIIAASLQHLSVLESLDLSSNKIGGEIPQQLVSLTSLAVLNFLTIILLDAFLKKSNLICLRTVHTKGMMVYVDCHSQKIVVAIMGYRKRQL